MKNLFKISLVIIAVMAFSTNKANAQQMSVGGGLVYASSVNSLGISLNGNYQFTEQWSAAPAFTYFLKKDDYWTRMTLDLDANYLFKEIDGVGGLYGIGGLALTFDKFNFGSAAGYPGYDDGDFSSTNTSLGLNLGIGFNYALAEKMTIAPELRYTIMNGGYLRIGAKFMYSL